MKVKVAAFFVNPLAGYGGIRNNKGSDNITYKLLRFLAISTPLKIYPHYFQLPVASKYPYEFWH